MGRDAANIEAGPYSAFAKAIVEGAEAGAYRYAQFKSGERLPERLARIVMTGLNGAEQRAAAEGQAIAQAMGRARDNGNCPPNMMTPSDIATLCEEYVRRTGATLRVRDEFELAEEGFGGLLAVGGGSANPPRFITLEREVDPAWPLVAIAGKAITFDSGGLSLKPRADLAEEKWDKNGGMAALGILDAVAALNIPVNLIVAICAAENMPGTGAMRPGDVIRTYGGTSVEILDCDAEGRLVLADALAFFARNHKPALTIDIATLTGACCVALGMDRTGLFTPDDELAELFHRSGESSGDLCWRLPLGEEFSADMEGTISDLCNTGSSRWGGASKAAAFLQHFAGEGRWVHLDIAGTGMPDKARPWMEKGATAAGLRLVVEALRRLYPAG